MLRSNPAMQAQIKLGRVLGIEIGLHYSWLIIALLITLSLSGHFHSTNPEWSNAVVWFAAVATAFLFFAAIVIHELSHSIVAKSRGLAVRSITLFALGGVPQTEKDSPDSKTEFWMAIAVDEVMRPLDQLRTVTRDTPVITALEIMGREDVNQLPVILHGALEGIISRSHIVQLLQSRAELNR